MFRNRTSNAKPTDALYDEFRTTFPQVASAMSSASHTHSSSLQDEQVAGDANQDHGDADHLKDQDHTPRPSHESWRFTPSLLDVNSFAFQSFANQPSGCYTPTSGGTNTFYHNQAGDLHTPGMGMSMGLGFGLGTPLSGPSSQAGLHATAMMDFSSYGQTMNSHQFHNYNPFSDHALSAQQQQPQQQPQQQQQQQQQQSYAPSSFVHQDTGYETMEQDGSPMDDSRHLSSMDMNMHPSPVMSYQPRQYDMTMTAPLPISTENFRFHVTLNAPTAMIKHADEIPVTYLNKGQAYSISIVDTTPVLPLPQGSRYRTFVRISFEDEQQRQRPATCWQLWKEGRGTNEAHQRGGKLQAVEYVEASQPAESDDKRTRVELDTASFDGFSVVWTPGVNGATECNVAVRFNFLSTDFSHSKGVKGIPVRLCAKTEQILAGSPSPTALTGGEVAFCKVKLFRDHGAERKLSNDVAHVKKTIDKLKQQIAQSETGLNDIKRKRTSSISGNKQTSQRPGKVQKHKRTWSISSTSSVGGRLPLEEDLHYKLQTMQDMFTSTRPVSILYLRGFEQDDPDLFPVALVGEPLDLTKADSRDNALWQQRSGRSSTGGASNLVSPSTVSISLPTQSTTPVAPWVDPSTTFSAEAPVALSVVAASPAEKSTSVPRKDESGQLGGWIEALGVDPNYLAPPERSIKPVACFYVHLRDQQMQTTAYYRAVYLMQRTLEDFTTAVATKFNLAPVQVARTLRVLERGLEVEVDDDVIRELSEGQDMILEIVRSSKHALPVKREWDVSDDIVTDGSEDAAMQNAPPPETYDLRLMF